MPAGGIDANKAKGRVFDRLVEQLGWSRANARRQLAKALTGCGPFAGVKRLPNEVVKHEGRIEDARQEYRDAAKALSQPFKYSEALEVAKSGVERITRTMNGEENPQPTLDPELQAHRRRMRAEFPHQVRRASPPTGRQPGSPPPPRRPSPPERKNRGEDMER